MFRPWPIRRSDESNWKEFIRWRDQFISSYVIEFDWSVSFLWINSETQFGSEIGGNLLFRNTETISHVYRIGISSECVNSMNAEHTKRDVNDYRSAAIEWVRRFFFSFGALHHSHLGTVHASTIKSTDNEMKSLFTSHSTTLNSIERTLLVPKGKDNGQGAPYYWMHKNGRFAGFFRGLAQKITCTVFFSLCDCHFPYFFTPSVKS